MGRCALTVGLATSLLCIATFASSVLAVEDWVEVRGEESYTYGDSESLVAAKEKTRGLAIRRAIESYVLFVQATSTIQDFQVVSDLIQTIASGYLHDLQVEQQQVGRTIYVKVRAYVVPSEISAVIQQASTASPKMEAILRAAQQRVKEKIEWLSTLIPKLKDGVEAGKELFFDCMRRTRRYSLDHTCQTSAWTESAVVLRNAEFELKLAQAIQSGRITYDKVVGAFGPPLRAENRGDWFTAVWPFPIAGAKSPGDHVTATYFFTRAGVAYDYRFD